MAKKGRYEEYTDTELQDGGSFDERAEKEAEKEVKPDASMSFADAAVKTAVKQLEEGVKARMTRFDEIAKSEAQYRGEKTKALKGRHNIPFDSVIARGFVDTLMSKVDESLQISFERSPGRQQDKKPAEKISAVCEYERGPDQGMWDLKDIGVKKLAAFSGRGIYKKFASRSSGEFRDIFEPVDHWDFVTEPQGGGFLDAHLYKHQMNIFRTRGDIVTACDAGYYDKKQAYRMFAKATDSTFKKNQELYRQKVSRQLSMGTDFEQNMFVGAQIFRLTETVMYFRGGWYNVVWNYDTGIWLRCEKLEDVYSVAKHKPGRGAWVSWATHFDPFDFWSIAPMDSVRPIAYAMKKVLNLSLDNLEKRNWNMRAYDPNVFNPRDLLWKDQGLVKANIRQGQNISNHIYHFETPDTTNVTVNLVEYMNNFLGEKTGITPGAQGKTDDTKVGIYFGNIQQVADRLGLTNKMYEQAHVDVGVNFQYGLLDHMPETYAVKVIGNSGIEWNEELKRDEVNRKFTIRIRGTDTEEKMNAILSQRKEKALLMIMKDPEMRQRTNAAWRIRETLALGGYDLEDTRVALDTNSDADDDVLAEAAQAIEDIISGRKPKMNRGATTGYIRKIVEYAYDTELDKPTFEKLMKFAKAHISIAEANAARKVAAVIAASSSRPPAGEGGMPTPARMGPGGGELPMPQPETVPQGVPGGEVT